MIAHVRMAARICGTVTRKCEPDLTEDVDRDDDRGDVQARVADGRQNQRVAPGPNGERSAGHVAPSSRSAGTKRRPTTIQL